MDMDRKDFLLMVVAAGEGTPITPVQLQKSLFLIRKANLKGAPIPFYDFEPYHYGPFSADIYRDVDLLQMEGFVLRTPSGVGSWTETAITPAGLARADSLRKNLPSTTLKHLSEVVGWVRSLSFSDLLKAIYTKYPEFRENSVFQE